MFSSRVHGFGLYSKSLIHFIVSDSMIPLFIFCILTVTFQHHLLKKRPFSSLYILNALFVNYLTVDAVGPFWALYSLPLIYVFVFVHQLCSRFELYNLVIELEIRRGTTHYSFSKIALTFQNYLSLCSYLLLLSLLLNMSVLVWALFGMEEYI